MTAHSYSTMSSCETVRKSAYNEDLWWYMVWQRETVGPPYDAIGCNLDVDKSTILRTVQLFHETESDYTQGS